MNRFILTVCLFVWGLGLGAWAQKKKTAVTPVPTLTAEQLIQNYRFDEAAQKLQTEIDAARKAGKPTERLEADLRRANLGSDLLRGTERVVFIDSLKVKRANMLSALRLSRGMGELVNMEDKKGTINSVPAQVGKVAYINELGDRIYFSASDKPDASKTICAAYRSGKIWGKPMQLEGMDDESSDQDYPFVMPDGVTLYYASQGEGSLGGYDIFVTRYNPETKQYLKADNVGFPFNSPANDYLLAIDEDSKLGWLVTDRYQNADTVCVYVFIPSDTREVYDLLDYNMNEVVNAAKLNSIVSTQTDKALASVAKARLASLSETATRTSEKKDVKLYVINNQTVYTDLSQFRNSQARNKAQDADKIAEKIEELTLKQDDLQRSVAEVGRTQKTLKQLEQINQVLPQLKAQYQMLCKEMRKAESQ